jgi:hypothetical protein
MGNWKDCFMKTTVEIPDELYRKLKAKAALQGKKLKAIAISLFEQWVSEAEEEPPLVLNSPLSGELAERQKVAEAWLQEWQAIGREVQEKSVDPRSTVDILLADRR